MSLSIIVPCILCGSCRVWHPPRGQSSSTLQHPAEPWPCAPGSVGHIFQLPGQFCGWDMRSGTCIWGAWCSSGTSRSDAEGYCPWLVLLGFFQYTSLQELLVWDPYLPLSAKVSFWLAHPPLALNVLPPWPSVSAVWFGMILVIALAPPVSLHPPFLLFILPWVGGPLLVSGPLLLSGPVSWVLAQHSFTCPPLGVTLVHAMLEWKSNQSEVLAGFF